MSAETIYAASWLINPDAPPLAGGALLVRDGAIIATGPLHQLRSSYAAPICEFPGTVLLPGFINAHTHLELTHFPSWLNRSKVDYQPHRFTDWIIQLIKITRGLADEELYRSIHEGVRMCLESGTTAIGEIVTNPAMAEQYYHSPLAGRLYFELIGQESGHFQSKLTAAMTAIAKRDETEKLFAGLSPHSPYTIAFEHLPAIREVAISRALPLAIHLSESRSEADIIFDGTGDLATNFYPFVGWERFVGHSARCSSTELLDRYGLLTPTTIAVHCVHTSVADAHILKTRGVHIALCPRSNKLLDVGHAPVNLFKKLGIPLTLGTDSLASNNSLSLWDELRFALECFPNDLSEQDLFNMVTIGGAEALGISASCGSLTVGKRADFQVVNINNWTENEVLERVIREGSVQEVFVGGVRYSGGS
ncbi:MAG: amidohydrolase family protein [Desulfuromonadaceae bacterium]|nr:amidohydrolase family protein [Desulfuromonadaceae bacterium]MDD5104620.1 amidohydrolase family protein [Desulfuromonadaceae bacterium]